MIDWNGFLGDDGELSDEGLDWAMDTQDSIPVGQDTNEYLKRQLEGAPEAVRGKVLEAWSVSADVLVDGWRGSKPTMAIDEV